MTTPKILVSTLAITVAVGGLALSADAAAPCKPAQLAAAKRTAKILRGRVVKLRAENKRLAGNLATATTERDAAREQLATVTAERDAARQQLAQAQSGVNGALGSMTSADIWPLFTTIAGRYTSARYSASYFSSGTDYRSWSFTYCGFC